MNHYGKTDRAMHSTGSIQQVLRCLRLLSTMLLLWTISIPATAQQTPGDEQDAILVHLLSGRTMMANIDARTDAAQLWLRWERPGSEVLRPIDWNRVVAAEIKGNKISGPEFLELVKQIRLRVPAQPVSAPAVNTIVMLGSPSIEAPNTPAPANSATQFRPPPVEWLDIEGGPARWDNYVETDGMIISIAPKDAYGEVVPVRGTLDVDLIAEHAGVVRLPYQFFRIAHWSQAVRIEDFGPYGAVYRLPFQDLNPDFSRDLGPHGAIHATLSVPGQGTFEATEDARIRPYSLIRDRLWQTTGRRFFPEETIGRPWGNGNGN